MASRQSRLPEQGYGPSTPTRVAELQGGAYVRAWEHVGVCVALGRCVTISVWVSLHDMHAHLMCVSALDVGAGCVCL
jgi:hypothetical protein